MENRAAWGQLNTIVLFLVALSIVAMTFFATTYDDVTDVPCGR